MAETQMLVKSSHQRCSVQNGVLKNFAKVTGKHLCQSLFFNKVSFLIRPATSLKKGYWHRCFPVNFAKFLRTPLFTERLWTTASGLWNVKARVYKVATLEKMLRLECL